MKILVFTEGTIIMHPSAAGLSRKQRVQQSITNAEGVRDYANYIPTGNAVKKLKAWKRQELEIFYLTSRTARKQIAEIKRVLEKYNFPDNQNLFFRKEKEKYKDVAEKLMPDVLVEDDCESIGGEKEMTYTYIKPKLKEKIKLISVKEFGGIDHLPDGLEELLNYQE